MRERIETMMDLPTTSAASVEAPEPKENDEFRPSHEAIQLMTQSPNFVAIASTLTLVRFPEETNRVIPLIEGGSGQGKSSFARCLPKILKPTDGSEYVAFVTNAPNLSKPVADITQNKHGITYAYTVNNEAEANALGALREGKRPLIIIEEVRAANINYVASMLYRLMGDPQFAEVRYIGVTNPAGSYPVPDALAHENMRQRFGEPILMENLKDEPIIEYLRRMRRTEGYRPLYAIEPEIRWDKACEDFFRFIEQVVNHAYDESSDNRGIPKALRSERQTELFASHLLAAQSFLRVNGLVSDVLANTALYRAIATMRFGPAGAELILSATDQSRFPIAEFMNGDDETREKILSTRYSRIVAYSIRVQVRAWVRELADAYKNNPHETEPRIVHYAEEILRLSDMLEKHESPVAPILKRALIELFFSEVEFNPALFRAEINPADALEDYAAPLRKRWRQKR